MTKVIVVPQEVPGFQEDKDLAKLIRQTELLPVLDQGRNVIIDFSQVATATQSFVHALVGEALQKYGEPVLDRIEFRGCSPGLQDTIVLVVNYSLGGFTHGLDDLGIPDAE